MTEVAVGLWIGLMVAVMSVVTTDQLWKYEVVDRGFAIYCPSNGQWAWIGECNK